MINLSLECGAAGAELACNDDDDEGCPCAPGGCGGSTYAPRISNFTLTGGVPVFIYIGGYEDLDPADDNSGVLTIT